MNSDEEDVDTALACSAEQAEKQVKHCDEINEEQTLSELVNAEEFLASQGFSMLEFERQMFFDLLHSDGLVVCAK